MRVASTTRSWRVPFARCAATPRRSRLTDSVLNADRYGSLVEDLGVTRPPIVLIDRNGKARLVEGYVDAESLVQVVADAR